MCESQTSYHVGIGTAGGTRRRSSLTQPALSSNAAVKPLTDFRCRAVAVAILYSIHWDLQGYTPVYGPQHTCTACQKRSSIYCV